MGVSSSHSRAEIFLHVIFATKAWAPILSDDLLLKIKVALQLKATELGIRLLEANGYIDHIHLLIQISPRHRPSEIIGQLKEFSSHQNPDLKWQIGYAVFSIDQDRIPTISQYIRNQKEHHQSMDYRGEMMQLEKNSLAMGLSP